ncbi:hypothetical protein JCM10908_000275 [Rhodotorula pacifica]|uniref:histone methyltransferase SET1 n=1 Tax=Rhodotorula pacifica TaxID=1495444 RepID=UPI00317526BA
MAREDERDSSANLSRPQASSSTAPSARRPSSPRSRDSRSPELTRSRRSHDERRRRYSDSRGDSPDRDAYYDRYNDRDRPGPSRRSRYDDDDEDDYYYSSRSRKRSPSPRYRRSPSPSYRHRTHSRRSPSPPPSRSSHHHSSSHATTSSRSRHDDKLSNGHSHRSPESRDRRDLPPPSASSSSRDHAASRDRDAPRASSTRPRQTISIALPTTSSASASTSSRRPLEAFSASGASASSSAATATTTTSAARSKPVEKQPAPPPPPVADKVPPFFYKPLKSKDYKVEYDPVLDTNPIKKGKVVQYRYDGQDLPDEAGSKDPRGSRDSLERNLATAKRHLHVKRVGVITYNWDKNSRGPAPPIPPCAILVTDFPPTTSGDAIHAHFRSFGRIDQVELKRDPKTGGNLGICWIKYKDDVPRDLEPDRPTREKYEAKRKAGQAQDGAVVAKDAVARGNGAKIGLAMLRSDTGVKVVMDAEGKLCKAAVDAELLRLYPPPPPKPKEEPTRTPAPRPVSASSTPRASTSTPALPAPPPPPPSDAPPPPPSLPPPPPPGRHPLPVPPSRPSASRDVPSDKNAATRWAPAPASLPARPNFVPFTAPPTVPKAPPAAPSYSGSSRTARGESPPELRLARPSMPIPPLPSARLPSRPDRRRDLPPPAPLAHPKLGRRPGYGRSDEMSTAIAQAVERAKRRVQSTNAQTSSRAGESDSRKHSSANGADDKMDISSDGEGGKSDSDSSSEKGSGDESDARNRLHYDYALGKSQVRRVLPHGVAPVGAIAWQVSKKILLEKLRSNGHPYLLIERRPFQEDRPTRSGPGAAPNNEELQRYFGKYGIDRTFADADGWYITFRTGKAAKDAEDALQGRRFAGAPLKLKLCSVPDETPASAPVLPAKPASRGHAPAPGSALEAIVKKLAHPPPAPKVKKQSGWTDAELLDEAKDIVIADLLDAFQTDIISRLVRGKVQEHLTRWEQGGMQSSKVHDEEDVGKAEEASAPSASLKSISSLSFGKRRSAATERDPKPRVKPSAARRLASETPSETPSGGHADSDTETAVPSRRASPAKSKAPTPKPPIAEDVSSDEEKPVRRVKERPKKPVAKAKKAPKKAKVHLDYTSSEDETPQPASNGGLVTVKEEPSLVDEDVVSVPVGERAVVNGDSQDMAIVLPDEALLLPREERSPSLHALPTPKKSTKAPRKSAPAKKAPPPPPSAPVTLDPFEAGIAQDEEDLFYLKLALQRLQIGKELNPTPPVSDEELDPPVPPPKHATGSARTEGFYAITVEEKMANRPASNKARSAQNGAAANAAAASSVAVSRLARANTRGLVRGMELHKKVTATDTDVLKFNQLKTRKKQLTFARSGIEGYGLFALEHIPVGDMVIEYVGELIRQTVADRREKAYERSGIGSSYLFRVDEDLVVDATKKGNLGRLINHCCAPNCTARIITINGVKKIVIYAKSNIEPGEEVTYDYHFPIEEDNKIPCLCGADACKTWLN